MDRESEELYAKMTCEEKNEYLEGKVALLQKNLNSRREEHETSYRALLREKRELEKRMEKMREESAQAKKEARERGGAWAAAKKQKKEAEKEPEEDAALESSRDKRKCRGMKIEWIISNIKGTIDFELKSLGSEKLKRFGRFFKEEFDSMYEKDRVMKGLAYKGEGSRELVKIILYLSDRPEIVSQLLPYLFKRHIVPDSVFYVKDVVKILERTGVTSFLCCSDTAEEMRGFFEACSSSRELVLFVLDGVAKSVNSVGRLVSEKYLAKIGEIYPEECLKIVERLESSGIRVCTNRAREVVHKNSADGRRSVYSKGDLHFFF